jgi:hypothetical protein
MKSRVLEMSSSNHQTQDMSEWQPRSLVLWKQEPHGNCSPTLGIGTAHAYTQVYKCCSVCKDKIMHSLLHSEVQVVG